MRTQVGIIGAGPAGLLLAHAAASRGHRLRRARARSRAYVEGRVRAGVLEQGTVDLMHELGVGERLRREGMIDEAIDIRFDGKLHPHRPPGAVAGKVVTIYGQTEVVKDLIAARSRPAAPIAVRGRGDARSTASTATGRRSATGKGGTEHELDCDFIAGCDGFHGVCRAAIPDGALTHLRAGLSVRLARHPVRVAADPAS